MTENRTRGLLQSSTDNTVVPVTNPDELIPCKPSDSLEPLVWVRAADFDPVSFYRLSEEEIRAISEPKFSGGHAHVVWAHGTPTGRG
jgi:hypothetical protein